MAKQAEDLKTIELLTTPAKRGRPASGKAMSATARKQAQRARDKELLWHTTPTVIADVTTDGLLIGLAECVTGGYTAMFEAITDELRTRTKAAREVKNNMD